MLFKDKSQKMVLPVWLSQLDAGITIHQNAVQMGSSPYELTWKILKPLGIYLKKCYFTELRGHQQYVDLHFEGHPKLKTISSRADEAVSFCLSVQTQFYCKPEFFEKCRIIETEIKEVNSILKKQPGITVNKHPYIN